MTENELNKVISDHFSNPNNLKEILLKVLNNTEAQSITEEEKRKAAYVLNMCTVSVSQIIDYEDINVLEQEYEAILNNINLETMPKDEALLKIFKQLLDTITFFRIQEGDKQMVEKEYQQNVKNAIWNAVPNFGLIVAGGNPLTIAISLASQVGIGYMNYRRNKAKYNWEKEQQLWKLQRTAIEQFNGLRRELFDTAWRLADIYKFPDEYRLTERQISQYNKILMDTDPLKQYERLDSIKGKFEAYPPFWYFIGHAANYIACNDTIGMSKIEVEKYRNIALKHFETFEELIKFNILREDQLAASCILEHVDILLLHPQYDINKVMNLLNTAVKMSGNKFDILELCAIAYLRIREGSGRDKAEKILRILVNEDYNKIINAQLLSGIYVKNRNENDYKILQNRVDSRYLYPMPAGNQNAESVEENYIKKQKEILKEKYNRVVAEVIKKYTIRWNKLIKYYDDNNTYPERFFYDSSESNDGPFTYRLFDFSGFKNKKLKTAYIERLKNKGYELSILEILNDFCNELFSIRLYDDITTKDLFVKSIKNEINKNSIKLNEIQNKIYGNIDDFDETDYEEIQELKFSIFIKPAFEENKKDLIDGIINDSDIKSIMNLDSNLRDFCKNNNYKEPEIYFNNNVVAPYNIEKVETEYFEADILGQSLVKEKQVQNQLKELRKAASDFVKANPEIIKGDNAVIYDFESPRFETYLKMIKAREDMKNITLLVIKGEEKCKDVDLLVTLGWVIRVKNNNPDYYCPWEQFIEQSKDNNELTLKEGGWFTIKLKYENSSVDKLLLLNLIDNLASTNNCKGDFSGDKSYTVQAADIATSIVSGFDPIVGFLVKKGVEHFLN